MTQQAVEILLVEDNPDDVELMLHALRKEKLSNNIHVVRDGEEALDFAFCRKQYAGRGSNDNPKLILLDLKLPKLDGLEVLRQLKSNPTTRSIPVVMLTTSKEERDMVASYTIGVNSYLQKPVDFAHFRNMVKQLGFYWLMVNRQPNGNHLPASEPAEPAKA